MPKDRTEATVLDTARSHAVHLTSQLKQLSLRATAGSPPTCPQMRHVNEIHAQLTGLLVTLSALADDRQTQQLKTLLRTSTQLQA